MGFNIEKYVKRSAKDAFSRISDDVSNKLQDAATNAVAGVLGKGLKAIGLSNKIVNDVTSRFADSVRAELAGEWYETTDPVLNRVSGQDIKKNKTPSTKNNSSPASFERDITKGANEKRGGGKSEAFSGLSDKKLGRYFCAFEFRKYQRPAPQLAATDINLKTIFLPIPRNLVETHSISYENAPLGTIGGVADALQKGENPGMAGGVLAGDVILKSLQKIDVLDTGAGAAAATFIQQAYGFAANPHLSVLFKGGTLRKHTFSWVFAPESKEESKKIKEIINDFRKYSLPTFFGDTNAVFDYPAMCKVRFFPWATNNASGANYEEDLYAIKQCMIENIVVNYAPNGIPSFFTDDSPTMIEFEVQLQEIEYFTSGDYGAPESDRKFAAIVPAVEGAADSLKASLSGGGEPTAGNERSKPRTAADFEAGRRADLAKAAAGQPLGTVPMAF